MTFLKKIVEKDGRIYRTLGTLCGNCKETQLREFHRILLTVSRKRNLGF